MRFQKAFHHLFTLLSLSFLLLSPQLFAEGRREGESRGAASGKALSIAVFVPGVLSGSPIYEMLAQGVQKAADEASGVRVKVVEGGFNQAEWETKLTSLAASRAYDLIVSSNPAIPALCANVSKNFPNQQFLLLDGELAGNPSIYTLRYNQREQAYLAGHLAALVSKDGLEKRKSSLRLGLVAGQEYPAMNGIILPGFKEGARAVDPEMDVDFRVVGNWFDAAKGTELASSMIRDGVSVILAIAGGANQGVLQAASEAKAYVVWFDIDGYSLRPGTVAGSAVIHQDMAAYEQVKRYLAGTLPFGSSEIVGVADGYVDFLEDNDSYRSTVNESIRFKQSELIKKMKSGELKLSDKAK
ncbi:BMP family ABC transporter substrate-binding protein [Treponema sp.]